jgi:chromosome segregation protein
VLRLKKLQILGFKSFCDRTELKFHGEGIAAIVGPNGCGKSNIADAIAWVLGEQSAKSLRGARMEDVICIGTRERKPTGMAEVSLTLINPEEYDGNAAPAEPEIEIQDKGLDDWDEAAVRAQAVYQTERAVQEIQPLGPEEIVVEGASPEQTGVGETSEPEIGADNAENGNGKHVVLKIRRRKFKPVQFRAGEIVVTRRLFRSGESEYLLNGKICRLRDIQDLFMGTGLGPESYAIIEQGRIGQILSSKPHDRRAIIEEAAGVTKFKTRKRLAEARLEQSKLNLARINDIFEEVTRQMNSLKRQASKAERYARLRDELRSKLRIVLAGKFAQLERESVDLQGQLQTLGQEVHAKTESVAEIEAQQAAATERGYALEQEARLNAERLAAITLEADRAAGRRRHNQERCTELEARDITAGAERSRAQEQLAKLEQELAGSRLVLESAASDVSSAQAELAARQQETQEASVSLEQIEAQQEHCRAESLATVAALAEARNQVAKAEQQSASLQREWTRIQQETASLGQQMAAFGGERGQIAFEFESATQAIASVDQQIANARASLEEKRAAEAESKLRLDGLRAEYATTLGKKSSLDALIAEHGYSTESVKRLFQSGGKENTFSAAGVLADFIEVEDRYESVVEDFLRDELNYIVVKSWDAADEGLRMLRTGVDGRATFLVHPEDSQARFSFAADDHGRHAPPRSSIVPLKDCIRVLNGFGKSLEVILSKLGNGYIAPDSAIARDMALENPSAFFLSPNGETFHNVTVTGGKPRREGPLSMKRELRDVVRNIAGLEESIRAEESKIAVLSREIAQLGKLLERLEEEKREGERRAMTSGHALQQLDGELQRARQKLAGCDAEAARLRSEYQQAQEAIALAQRQAAEQQTKRQELESTFAAAQIAVAAWKERREAAAQQAAAAASRMAALEERRIAAAAGLERIERMASEVSQRLTALDEQARAAAAERAQRLNENQQLEQQLLALKSERQAAQTRSGSLQTEADELRSGLQVLEQRLRQLRHELDAARDRRGELAAAAAKLASDVEYLGESCRNELNLGREELMADLSIMRLEGELLAQEEVAHRELRAKLEAMGPVNMMALEEYNEIAQRHGFLETQRKDLLESIENTQATIKELDEVSRQKFEEAFGKINENFQATFRKLFGGGQAFMRLTDLENSTESGIDVIASPPGKKLQNVLLLSGGEKALTALALLVGIFQYQPSPFCLLDEVDAPLDEANVGRFTEMVRELAAQTQFVIITHNKRTMSASPVMYGVTMQEPGVSKIVSVRFGEQATA